ncbi:hypothetical protein ACET3Z_009818 [Daucus carota]
MPSTFHLIFNYLTIKLRVTYFTGVGLSGWAGPVSPVEVPSTVNMVLRINGTCRSPWADDRLGFYKHYLGYTCNFFSQSSNALNELCKIRKCFTAHRNLSCNMYGEDLDLLKSLDRTVMYFEAVLLLKSSTRGM